MKLIFCRACSINYFTMMIYWLIKCFVLDLYPTIYLPEFKRRWDAWVLNTISLIPGFNLYNIVRSAIYCFNSTGVNKNRISIQVKVPKIISHGFLGFFAIFCCWMWVFTFRQPVPTKLIKDFGTLYLISRSTFSE